MNTSTRSGLTKKSALIFAAKRALFEAKRKENLYRIVFPHRREKLDSLRSVTNEHFLLYRNLLFSTMEEEFGIKPLAIRKLELGPNQVTRVRALVNGEEMEVLVYPFYGSINIAHQGRLIKRVAV